MALDLSRHPCFNGPSRHTFGRIHLPVAPDCNVQCNFCKRKYDCANESRPGVTSALLTPPQALKYLEDVLKRDTRIAVAGIAGPGDPFATPERTLETLRLVRRAHPELLLCVASNGLAAARHADDLAALEVSHVTLTVNAVDPEIGAKVYAWVRDGKRVYRGVTGAELLWTRQAEAIRALHQRGVTVKINTIIIPGINDEHVPHVARRVAELGADIANCVPLYPVAGTAMASVVPPSPERVAALRAAVAAHLPIMEHCTRCRADAVGLLGEPMPPRVELALLRAAAPSPQPDETRPCVAVATIEGMLVNQHLGEADRLAIFRPAQQGFELVETRRTPPPGGGRDRWLALAETLDDCRALLVASAGEAPRSVLADRGIRVIFMEGLIEAGLDAVYRGAEIRSPMRREHRCGSGCAGSGQGCM
ncbi:MAG: radical SAM protein [Thermoguttaceae bacterium]|jgi:nitrogen fixation protein NifB